jgi:hypothetical protein
MQTVSQAPRLGTTLHRRECNRSHEVALRHPAGLQLEDLQLEDLQLGNLLSRFPVGWRKQQSAMLDPN